MVVRDECDEEPLIMSLPQTRPLSSSSSSSESSSSSSSSGSSSSSSSSSDEEESKLDSETIGQLQVAKRQYRHLKTNLHQVIRENEILREELKKHQRKLLRLNRDKYFLFERLLAYEKPSSKPTTQKEEKVEIIDGVPRVVRVGKKRGPKPKRPRPDDSPPQLQVRPPSSSILAAALEPGQSLLKKIKSSTTTQSPYMSPALSSSLGSDDDIGGGAAVASKKKSRSEMAPGSPSGGESSNVTFASAFSKSKAVPSVMKRQYRKQQQSNKQARPQLPPPPELSSGGSAEDTAMSAGSANFEFLRQVESFSSEVMPDQLFNDEDD